MDRRSWLWRRKSSDKSSGETESLGSGSGSISSPSERFSDEQQVYPIQNALSPEVTSNVSSHQAVSHDSVKILSEKLSAAVASIAEKEELVKQHSKVAEEAVNGWERADNEVNALKLQLDNATKKNSTLEDKIVHLDGALKECLRQLRQVREEQDQRVHESIVKKSEDTESKSSELQGQLADISAQLEIANAKADAAVSVESDLRLKLASAEKQISSLQHELYSQSEELEVRTLERDLSTTRAESASKQHLESIKKVAKLEAECRRLKIMARKGVSSNDYKSPNAPMSQGESSTDKRSDCEELGQFKVDNTSLKSLMTSSSNTGLMDDFLEMEKVAALPMRENSRSSFGSVTSSDKHDESRNDNTLLKAELEAMINRTAELEERVEMVEAEKVELGLTLTQCQDKLQLSESNFRQLQSQFNECQNQLKMSQAQLKDANKKLGTLQAELDLASELRQAIDLELDDANVRREEAEAQLKGIENESKVLLSRVAFLEGEAEKERAMNAKASEKCLALEDELSKMKTDAEAWQNQLASVRESKEAVERELTCSIGKKKAAESELEAVQAEAKTLLAKIGSLEKESQSETLLFAEFDSKCRKLEYELSKTKHEAETWHSQFTSVNDSKEAVTQELQMANTKKEEVERQLEAVQGEAKFLLARVSSLEDKMEKERMLSAEFGAKCKKLEKELSELKLESGIQFAPLSKEELSQQQEKELAVAASKLAECQQTIASLGNQLKSLATFEDLFFDSDSQVDISVNTDKLHNISDKSDKQFDSSENGSQLHGTNVEPASLHSSTILTAQSDSISPETGTHNSFAVKTEDDQPLTKDNKERLPSLLADKNLKNGLGKLFTRSRSVLRSQNS